LRDAGDEDLSRAEFTYKRLRQGIRSGEFRPGQRLREAELAQRLAVSRTPVREAIRRLVSDGLVEIAPSRGMMIIELDRERVRELYALRESLEGTAARLAAREARPEEIEEMRSLLARSLAALPDPAEMARLNRLFHNVVHAAARNRYLAQALVQLADSLALLPGTTFEAPDRTAAGHAEHQAIFEAIEGRRPEEAERLARQHIEAARIIRMRMMFQG
jgi:DNA-binding GntR family transcriptional regulator